MLSHAPFPTLTPPPGRKTGAANLHLQLLALTRLATGLWTPGSCPHCQTLTRHALGLWIPEHLFKTSGAWRIVRQRFWIPCNHLPL